MIGDTAVVQAWEHGKALGVLDLTLEDRRIVKAEGRLVEIGPKGGISNTEVNAIVEKYRGKVDAVLDETIGEALADLDGESVRQQETSLGDLIADIIRNAANSDAAYNRRREHTHQHKEGGDKGQACLFSLAV